MSEEYEAQSKRDQRRGEGEMWRSKIWAGLELDFRSDQEILDPRPRFGSRR